MYNECYKHIFCVIVQPVIISEITGLSDERRNMVNFTCKATGEPIPDISWFFNIEMINASDNSGKYMIMPESINVTTTKNTLTIYNATSSDVGIYICTASNVLGNDTSFGETKCLI